jgi:L-asparaginase
MKVQILTTGGTIDKLYFDSKSAYQVGDPQVGQLLEDANVTVEYEVRALLHKDSLDFTDDDRRLIVETVRDVPGDRVLITHGTDTMLETARELQEIEDKTIVLTGAIQPARLRDSDAFFNVGFAFCAVQALPPGTYVAMNGRIFSPENARKNVELGRFEEIA